MSDVPEIKRHLKDAWQSKRLSHAYIVSGGTADMRREVADHIAVLLLASTSKTDSASGPSNDEVHMKQLMSGTHPDLIRVTHEKPASISVDDIRRQLGDTIVIRPYETDNKLYIVDEAEKMTVQAQNAILKTIEEPPEYACLVLLTENPQVLLETIRSRCVQLKLSSQTDADEESASQYIEILRRARSMNVAGITETAGGLKDDKDGVLAFTDTVRTWLRDVLVLKTTQDAGALLFKDEAEYIQAYARDMELSDIEKALEAADEAESRITNNVNTELTLQLLLMQLTGR